MLLIVSIILTIVLFVCYVEAFNKDYMVVSFLSMFGWIMSGIVAISCITLFIGAHIPYCRTANKLKLEQQRAAIIYCLESSPESIVGLASDISKYNSTIMTGRLRNNNIWFSNITYDFYDELELIEVGSEK